MLFFDTITIVLPMGQNVLAKQIVDSIISSIKTYQQIIARAEKNNTSIPLPQQYQIEDIRKNIIIKLQDLYKSENFNENTMNRLINGIRDHEYDVDIMTTLLAVDDAVLKQYMQKSPLNSLQMLKDAFVNQIFGKINVNDIFTEICNQKLTLLAYRTKNGYKMTLCSPENIDKTLSKILPTVAYNGNIKINNCAYFGNAHSVFCEKYICNYNNLSQYDIAIIPSISHFSFLQSSATEDAKKQYKNFYEKIFKFFNEKNIPISLQQTSACKGNNFIFALINNIDKDTKIDKLEFSTLNILSGMLLPNFYSKYVDVAVKCFYNTNINNIKIHFSFPIPQEIHLHALPGSIGYATSTIEKILEKAENTGKTEQISILKKILKSFDTTINIIGNNEKQEPKKKHLYQD
ncbi:MAG: hypothetical protein IJT15_02090 [Rickettsiales bacterium]|nr:hypothetical protein [Rickettsiales bacterium]